MSELAVVAGATGYVGRHLVAALAERGYRVRAIVRSRSRAEQPGAAGAPSLAGRVAEWREGDITDPAFVDGVCAGADHVLSALGVTRQRANPWDIDYLANRRLLEDAERRGARSFLYINVLHADDGRSLILRSKAAFAHLLSRSPIPHHIINPSGFFSDVGEFLAMAQRGLIVLPPSHGIRIAPIHGADLAAFCLDRLSDPSGSWDVGGPDVLTYPEIAEAARAAVDRRCRIVTVPTPVLNAVTWLAARIGGRPAILAEFFAEGLSHDAVGDRHGEHHLAAYFADLARTARD